MKGDGTRSLRLRLLAGTLAWVLFSIAAAGWGLRTLFLDHITQQLQAQLVLQLDQLSAVVDWGSDGRLIVPPFVADPRLEQPLSGLYWQIDRLGDEPRAAVVRSRSLWDQTLALPPAPEGYPARGYRVLSLQDAQGHRLLAVARTLQLPDDAAPPLRLVVAGDQALLAEPLQGFTRMLLIALGVLAAGLALAVVLQLQLALRPLQLLRQRLAAVRAGTAAQLQGPFPQELQPLVTEFNHVLTENADMVQRARTQAGNLAHAVHTPLSVLANAAAQEPGPLGALVREQVDAARRQVDYHLARARRRRRARHRPGHAGAGARAGAAAHHAAPACRARPDVRARPGRAGRGVPRRAAGPVRAAGQPDRQRWQMGALARRGGRAARRGPAVLHGG